jgi:Flp pilus assembly protein TadD/uncharacterized protein (AIM24 family)
MAGSGTREQGPEGSQEERARVHWSVPPPPPGAAIPEAQSEAALGEEFLFHLYRGSELLQEDQVYEAKTELERAMAYQPRDVEGQSLLGVTYFRLGHYPRAIQIYEELVRVRPSEVAPRVNLGLCYLKTGQLQLARALLEELVQHRPEHTRAWGYLGLTFQRLGDTDKAAAAFDRAGRTELAARVRAGPSTEARAGDHEEAPGVQEISQDHVRAAPTVPPPPDVPVSVTVPGQGPPSVRRGSTPPPSRRAAPSASWLAPGTRVSIPAPLDRVAREATLVFPDRPRVVVHESGNVLVRIERAFHVRSDCMRALLPDSPGALTNGVLRRKGRTGLIGGAEDPLGGSTTPFVTLEGEGRLILGAPERFGAWVSTLDGEPFYTREERLLGFDGSLQHSSGRMSLASARSGAEGVVAALIQLTGSGFVALAVRGTIHGIDVSASRPIEVRAGQIVAWVGRLIPRAVPREEAPAGLLDLVALSGTGVVLVDGG